MPAAQLKPPADDGERGVDRNVRQTTDCDGEVYEQPDMSNLDANIKRKQRQVAKARVGSRKSGKPLSNRARRVCGQLRKLHRRKRRRRENAAINILDRGRSLIRQARGEGASARRGTFGTGQPR
ncbi:MAG: hypothetical protein F4Y80_13960 [Caldilineaceae bacterium SB0665_bin_21]|nr:hypothetical protein [Caldilineaceae bacterium SB0665_bin_21]MYA04781.1 hypothetical protein [Caldilineaceae bacterium SB0664_bin_22]MYC63179.1 hypothetical protein [Caldilineaceae bacterium SB0661_bin_34]